MRSVVHGWDGDELHKAVRQKAGRILAAGLTKEVTFEPVEGPVLDSIDEAFRGKND